MFDYMTHAQSVQQIDDALTQDFTILLLSAPWCGDCRFADMFMVEVMYNHPEINFFYVNRDDYIDFCQVLDIMGIPSFVAYKKGKEVSRFVSRFRKTKEEVEEFIASIQ